MQKLRESANHAVLETTVLMVPQFLSHAQLELSMLLTTLQVNVKHVQLASIAQQGQVCLKNVFQGHILQLVHLFALIVKWELIVLMRLLHH